MIVKNNLRAVSVKPHRIHYRVVAVDASEERRALLRRACRDFDCSLIGQLSSFDGLNVALERERPDMLLLGYGDIGEVDLNLLSEICDSSRLPTVLTLDSADPNLLDKCIQQGIDEIVLGSLQLSNLAAIFAMAAARFKVRQATLEEVKQLKLKLAERKVIEKAKGMLMESQAMTEDQAYSTLRKLAMDQGKSIGYVAQTTISLLNSFKGS